MKKKIYAWRQGFTASIDPEVVGQEFERLAKEGKLDVKGVVAAARPKRSPLHSHFEWDDSVAGTKYREWQARDCLGALRVTYSDDKRSKAGHNVQTSAYVSLGKGTENRGDNRYYGIDEVMSNDELRAQTLQKLWNQLLSLKAKYEAFTELSSVWDAIEMAKENYAKSMSA